MCTDPLKVSFEEAGNYFERALKLEPNEIRHILWLSKTEVKRNYLGKDIKMYCNYLPFLSLLKHDEIVKKSLDLQKNKKFIKKSLTTILNKISHPPKILEGRNITN